MPRRSLIRLVAATAVATLTLGLTGAAAVAKTGSAAKSTEPATLRLGYFPNVTHASAIVGVQGGILAKKLGSNVDLKLSTFNSGTEAVQAFQAQALDASYIGPNPTITAWTQFDKGVKVISGASSGGAYFVVKPDITKAADLKGKVIATPQLGNTQDVSLRTWLKKNGLNTDTNGGGDVSIHPQDNATSLNSFKTGDIQGAWVPEPWATRSGHGRRRQDPRRRGIAVAERSVRDHAAHRHHELPEGSPRRGAEAGERAGGGERLHQEQHRRRGVPGVGRHPGRQPASRSTATS